MQFANLRLVAFCLNILNILFLHRTCSCLLKACFIHSSAASAPGVKVFFLKVKVRAFKDFGKLQCIKIPKFDLCMQEDLQYLSELLILQKAGQIVMKRPALLLVLLYTCRTSFCSEGYSEERYVIQTSNAKAIADNAMPKRRIA